MRQLVSKLWEIKIPNGMPQIMPLVMPTVGLPWYTKAKAMFYDTRAYVLVKDFIYIRQNGEKILVPKGFCTDFASVPRVFWPLGLDPQGILMIPSIPHDFAYRHDFYLNENREKIYERKGKRFHDKLFREISIDVNEMYTPSYLSILALDVFGYFAWKKYKRDGELDLFGPFRDVFDAQQFRLTQE